MPARTAPAAATVVLLAPTVGGRTALAYAGTGLLLLLTLTAVLALRAAYAPTPTPAHRTLHLLLRLAPWYPDRP
ncbi:predicted protein [Streptomyces sp. SPB78]|nr:predicted protein [Streptomyces sp. SPB78]